MEDKVDKQSIRDNLETMKQGMVGRQHFDDAKVIAETLKHIRLLDTDLTRHINTNKELTKTISMLVDQANTKKNNLLNFHSANILQGMLIKGTSGRDGQIVNRVIKLAKLMISSLADEIENENKENSE